MSNLIRCFIFSCLTILVTPAIAAEATDTNTSSIHLSKFNVGLTLTNAQGQSILYKLVTPVFFADVVSLELSSGLTRFEYVALDTEIKTDAIWESSIGLTINRPIAPNMMVVSTIGLGYATNKTLSYNFLQIKPALRVLVNPFISLELGYILGANRFSDTKQRMIGPHIMPLFDQQPYASLAVSL